MSIRVGKPHSNNWRGWIIGGYVAVVALLAILWGFSLFSPIDTAEINQQYENMHSTAYASAYALENSSKSASETVSELAASSNNLRMTVISNNGIVIADSVENPASMGNHVDRPEVAAALSGVEGRDQRMSETDNVEYLYLAVPAKFQGTPVVLRVATPVSEVNTLAQQFRNTGLLLLLASVALALLIAWFTFSRSSRPMSRLETMRTDFVANASHELKTLVAGIKLLSESISNAYKDGDLEMIPLFAERLDKETTRMQNLLANLLDLSRLEGSASNNAVRESTDMYSAVTTAFESQRARAERRGLKFTFNDNIQEGDPCRVKLSASDATLLASNLIENAISYTEKGGVTVTLDGDDKNLTLSVADTGIGIPIEDQNRIFERFYRVDKARSREEGGTGLGLSLVRHAVERGKGTISLDSKLGEGSTFTVTLPRSK